MCRKKAIKWWRCCSFRYSTNRKVSGPKFEQNILLVREPDEAFDMAGENLLRTALKRTHKERFFK